jgi:hypothetical protein
MNDGMIFKEITDLQDLHIEQLHALYQDEWWTKGRSLELTRRCVKESQVCLGLVDQAGKSVSGAWAWEIGWSGWYETTSGSAP